MKNLVKELDKEGNDFTHLEQRFPHIIETN